MTRPVQAEAGHGQSPPPAGKGKGGTQGSHSCPWGDRYPEWGCPWQGPLLRPPVPCVCIQGAAYPNPMAESGHGHPFLLPPNTAVMSLRGVGGTQGLAHLEQDSTLWTPLPPLARPQGHLGGSLAPPVAPGGQQGWAPLATGHAACKPEPRLQPWPAAQRPVKVLREAGGAWGCLTPGCACEPPARTQQACIPRLVLSCPWVV